MNKLTEAHTQEFTENTPKLYFLIKFMEIQFTWDAHPLSSNPILMRGGMTMTCGGCIVGKTKAMFLGLA